MEQILIVDSTVPIYAATAAVTMCSHRTSLYLAQRTSPSATGGMLLPIAHQVLVEIASAYYCLIAMARRSVSCKRPATPTPDRAGSRQHSMLPTYSPSMPVRL